MRSFQGVCTTVTLSENSHVSAAPTLVAVAVSCWLGASPAWENANPVPPFRCAELSTGKFCRLFAPESRWSVSFLAKTGRTLEVGSTAGEDSAGVAD